MLQNKNSLSMGWGLKAALGGAGVDNAVPVPELVGLPSPRILHLPGPGPGMRNFFLLIQVRTGLNFKLHKRYL